MNGSPFLSRVPASADGDHHLTGPDLARISRLASICDARRGCRGWCGMAVSLRSDRGAAPSLVEIPGSHLALWEPGRGSDVIEVDRDAVEIGRPERAVRAPLVPVR